MGRSRKKLKNAFTLTEVAIVIAVITIIIAVLIPTFITLISSANKSNDSVTVNNINNALSINEATYGKPDNVLSAFDGLYKSGYTADYFTLNDGRLVYDLNSNSMLIYSNDFTAVTYPEESSSTAVIAAYYEGNSQDDLYVVGIEDIEIAVSAGFTNFYLYSNEDSIEVNTTSQINLWLYTESEDVQVTAKNAYVYHNKSTAICDSLDYIPITDGTYSTADIGDTDYSGESQSSVEEDSTATETSSSDYTAEDSSSAENSTEESSGEEVHEHAYNICEIVTAATCLQEGLIRHYCTCGDYIEKTIDKLEHNYSEWEVTHEATCSEDGLKCKICECCGDTITEDISALGHLYVETIVKATVDNEGCTTYTCSLCNDTYSDNFTGYLCTEELKFEKSSGGTYIVTCISDTTVKNIYIPSYYKGEDDSDYLPVTEIAASAFEDNDNIVNVTIGYTVEIIGKKAFYGCEALKKVNIPKSLTTLGDESFSRCTYLSEIYYEAECVKTLEETTVFLQAGYYSKDLTVYISKEVKFIPEYLFDVTGSSKQVCIVSIIFEEGCNDIEISNYAFYYLPYLKSIILPTSITSITTYKNSLYVTSSVSIYYMGTESQWINSAYYGQTFTTKTENIYYYSDTESDGCWYYNDKGDIKLW